MKIKIIIIALVFLAALAPHSQAAKVVDLSHIHTIKILGKKILFGTHEGLYEFKSMKDIREIGSERFDVMGLSVLGGSLYASGHPGLNSKLPQPVGLLSSGDNGKNWQKISMQGKTDFHLLEITENEIYGGDSSSGNLYYSINRGKSWKVLGANPYSDIAINPVVKESAMALQQGKLYLTDDKFASQILVKTNYKISGVEWNSTRLIAASEDKLLISNNQGKSWKKLFSFPANVSVLTQSKDLIVVAAGMYLYSSADSGKTFQKK